MGDRTCHEEEEHQLGDVEQEDEAYNLEEGSQHGSHMAFGSHLQEDAEDVERQAGDDDLGDDGGDDVAEVDEKASHGGAGNGGSGETQHKGDD